MANYERLINMIKNKYLPCLPNDKDVIYFTTEELIRALKDILQESIEIHERLVPDLEEAGYMVHDIGDSSVMFRWCVKLNKM